jgi:hypothetical protein
MRVSGVNIQKSETDVFFEKHFVKIAFAASTIALLMISPFSLSMGAILGAGMNYYFDPDLRIAKEDAILTIPNTTVAIVGAIAALLRLSPGTVFNTITFKAVPLLASLAIGSTGYRLYRSFSA